MHFSLIWINFSLESLVFFIFVACSCKVWNCVRVCFVSNWVYYLPKDWKTVKTSGKKKSKKDHKHKTISDKKKKEKEIKKTSKTEYIAWNVTGVLKQIFKFISELFDLKEKNISSYLRKSLVRSEFSDCFRYITFFFRVRAECECFVGCFYVEKLLHQNWIAKKAKRKWILPPAQCHREMVLNLQQPPLLAWRMPCKISSKIMSWVIRLHVRRQKPSK